MDPIEKWGKSNCSEYILSKGRGLICTDGRSVLVVVGGTQDWFMLKESPLKIHTNRIWNAGKQHYPESYYPAQLTTLMSLRDQTNASAASVAVSTTDTTVEFRHNRHNRHHRHNSSAAGSQFEEVAVSSVLFQPTKTLVTFVTDLCHTLNQWKALIVWILYQYEKPYFSFQPPRLQRLWMDTAENLICIMCRQPITKITFWYSSQTYQTKQSPTIWKANQQKPKEHPKQQQSCWRWLVAMVLVE